MAKEMLGATLLSIHNVTYYQRLVAGARAAIEAGRFEEYYARKKAGWAKSSASTVEARGTAADSEVGPATPDL